MARIVYPVLRVRNPQPNRGLRFLLYFYRALQDPISHFLLAFGVGFLVSGVIWIILRVLFWVKARLTLRRVSTGVVFFTNISFLLVWLAVGLLSHWFLDFVYISLEKPLGPGLDLNVPPELQSLTFLLFYGRIVPWLKHYHS